FSADGKGRAGRPANLRGSDSANRPPRLVFGRSHPTRLRDVDRQSVRARYRKSAQYGGMGRTGGTASRKPGERGNRPRAEAVLLAPLWGATAGFCLLLIAMAWPEYWRYVAPETSPLAWWESVLLALSSFACLLLAWGAWRREERRAVRAG